MITQTLSGFNTRALDTVVLIALFVAVWQGLYEYAGDAAITSPLTTLGYASSLVKTSNFWSHAQATLAARAAKYPPLGRRSVGGDFLLHDRRQPRSRQAEIAAGHTADEEAGFGDFIFHRT